MENKTKQENEPWEYNGQMWHKCPKCRSAIPVEWDSHSKCGWVKGVEKFTDSQVREYVEKTIDMAKEIKENTGLDSDVLAIADLVWRIRFSTQEKR